MRALRPLPQQCALVTGGTNGVGAAAVLDLARRGVGLIVVTGRDGARADAMQAQVRDIGGRAETVIADLADRTSVDRIVSCVVDLGGIDILVNAAGLTSRASALNADGEIFDRLFDVNVRAPFFLVQRCAQHMQSARHGGSVVNVLSFAAYGGAPNIAVYAMTKAALAAHTRNAAFALRGDGIRVNGINIGWTLTPGEDEVMRTTHGEAVGWAQKYAHLLPLGRLLEAEEVGRAIGHLATDASAPMTGAIVDFDQTVYGLGDWPPTA